MAEVTVQPEDIKLDLSDIFKGSFQDLLMAKIRELELAKQEKENK